MKLVATLFMLSFSVSAGAALVHAGHAAEGKVVTIANLEERDGYIVVTFSGPLKQGAACGGQHRDELLIEWPHTALGETAKHAFALGQAVWGAGLCSKIKDIETMSIMQVTK